MIDISEQINKLNYLQVYMNIWIEHKAWILRMKNIFDETGMILYTPEPNYLTDFDNWYLNQII